MKNTYKYIIDAAQLACEWERFVDGDKELEHVHPSPGLSVFFGPLIGDFIHTSQDESPDDVFVSTMELVNRTIMFGMHLQRVGFDFSTLTKCPCMELDAEDEQKLLNGN